MAADTDILDEIASAPDLASVEALRIRMLGKSGEITAKLKSLGAMEPGPRDGRGAEDPCAARGGHRRARRAARRRSNPPSSSGALATETLDLSLPAPETPRGTIHPVSQVMDELAEIFADLGFAVAEGPEIETQWYNFTALNMPENHPARAMQDTFYLEPRDGESEPRVLRTHTSPVQIRADGERTARRSGSSRPAASIAPTATRRTRRCSTRSKGW